MTDLWTKIRQTYASECWEWTGTLFSTGYGRHRDTTAHRAVWIELYGNPGKLEVCHTCDNRKCCNPAHLFVGTEKDNAADKVAKNRQARFPGSLNQSAKLSPKQVLEIRASRLSHAELARRYHVSESNIRFIRNRGTWASVS